MKKGIHSDFKRGGVSQIKARMEGVVEHIDGETFVARVVDQSVSARYKKPQLATIKLEIVLPDDLELVEEGAVFYWHVGSRPDKNGSVRKFSEIRFRRMPTFTSREIEAAQEEAKALLDELW